MLYITVNEALSGMEGEYLAIVKVIANDFKASTYNKTLVEYSWMHANNGDFLTAEGHNPEQSEHELHRSFAQLYFNRMEIRAVSLEWRSPISEIVFYVLLNTPFAPNAQKFSEKFLKTY